MNGMIGEIIIVVDTHEQQQKQFQNRNNNNQNNNNNIINNNNNTNQYDDSLLGTLLLSSQQQQQQQYPMYIRLSLVIPRQQEEQQYQDDTDSSIVVTSSSSSCCCIVKILSIRTIHMNETVDNTNNTYCNNSIIHIRIHPLLYEYMYIVANSQLKENNTINTESLSSTLYKAENTKECNHLLHNNHNNVESIRSTDTINDTTTITRIQIAPLFDQTQQYDPFTVSTHPYNDNDHHLSPYYKMDILELSSSSSSVVTAAATTSESDTTKLTTTTINNTIQSLPNNAIITIQIIYVYNTATNECNQYNDENDNDTSSSTEQLVALIQQQLYGCIITKGAIIVVPIEIWVPSITVQSSSTRTTNTTFQQEQRQTCYYLIKIYDIYMNVDNNITNENIVSSSIPSVPNSYNIVYSVNYPTDQNVNTYPTFQIQIITTTSSSNHVDTNDDDNVNRTVHQLSTLSISNTTDDSNTNTADTDKNINSMSSNNMQQQLCPGYESIQEELYQLIQLSSKSYQNNHDQYETPAPTGIILTGCAGVGKTELVTSMIEYCNYQQQQQGYDKSNDNRKKVLYHYVSIHDLLLQASWADIDVITSTIQPPYSATIETDSVLLFVCDDLHMLGNNELYTDTNYSRERRIVLNSMIQVMDDVNQSIKANNSTQCAVLMVGIGRDIKQIPNELIKVGRFEKEIQMLPPSQRQREIILYHLLLGLKPNNCTTTQVNDNCHSIENEFELLCQRWAEMLATATAGCVASDLHRICSDACCSYLARDNVVNNDTDLTQSKTPANVSWPLLWDDLSEAVRNVTPSQLAMLDVTKPKDCLGLCSSNDWLRIHEISWEVLVGYDTIKHRLYRAVVIPWRRQMNSSVSDLNKNATIIQPPTGILFHGPSGCGKTVAASCLGSSLGLPMIKVRAADVMDKWLGGSEATIRSLFTRARSAAPCILFFDEIDAIASNRANTDGATADVMSRLLSTLLNEMDGISSSHQSNVIVVACTSRIESLDAALVRPGRLEEHIYLSLPTLEDVCKILQQKLSRAPLDSSIDLKHIASTLVERLASCADIEGICREAIFRSIRRCSNNSTDVSITHEDIENAIAAIKL